jgi:hypothetical protein
MTLAEFAIELTTAARSYPFPFPQRALRNTLAQCPIIAVAHLQGISEFTNDTALQAAERLGLSPDDAQAIVWESDMGATRTRVRTLLMDATTPKAATP